ELVDDLLAFARLRASVLLVQQEPVDLGSVVAAVVERRVELAAERGVQLRCSLPDAPIERFADAGRLGQVVANLVENALAHAGAQVVEVRVERRHGEDRIVVSDDGCGLRRDDLPYLFEAFYQAEDVSAGAGLGLAIARELTAAHGGTIEAANGALG